MTRHHHHHVDAGAVSVLDIGGDVGAVVVHLGDRPIGAELEMQPVGDPTGRFHTGVHDRLSGATPIRSAVFPEVRAGRHELLDRDGVPFAVVEAVGGEVTVLDLRGGTP